MSRINLLLLLALIVSSLYLVKVSYEGRRLYAELDRAKVEEHRLDTDYERLQVEQRAQATPLRVEKVAREKLGMRTANPAVTEYVVPQNSAASARAAQ
ncbi:MAG TPA: cell division protein FtsL [Methylibium sp.]